MSDKELFEIARGRIDQRNRRWTLWGIHLAALIAYVALFILISTVGFSNIALFILLAWGGLFTLHTLVVSMAQSRDGDIEKEVAKLRENLYEKPKRLELGEDGELVEIEDEEYALRRQND